MSEIISGMRVIKMYTWEESFAKVVADIRRYVRTVLLDIWTFPAYNFYPQYSHAVCLKFQHWLISTVSLHFKFPSSQKLKFHWFYFTYCITAVYFIYSHLTHFISLPCSLESREIKKTAYFKALNAAVYMITMSVICFLVFTTYVMTGNTLTPRKVFVVLGVFASIRAAVTIFFSYGIRNLKECTVSEKRIQV